MGKKPRPSQLLFVFLYSLPEGSPDMACCLLHQKLQMLSCCIRHKLAHQQKLNTHSSSTIQTHSQSANISPEKPQMEKSAEFLTPVSSWTSDQWNESSNLPRKDSDSGSDDEFYEALETQEEGAEALEADHESERESKESEPETHQTGASEDITFCVSESQVPTSDNVTLPQKDPRIEKCEVEESELDSTVKVAVGSDANKSEAVVERVGALKPCGDLVLIATGEPLYIPITQV